MLVAGDIFIDWLQWEKIPAKDNDYDAENEDPNWILYPGYNMLPQQGGTLLLRDMIKFNVKKLHEEKGGKEIPVISYKDIRRLTDRSPNKILHSNAILDIYHDEYNSKNKKDTYRIKEYNGFTGPADNDLSKLQTLDYDNNVENLDLIVLDDAGNSFRYNPNHIKHIVSNINNNNNEPIIILKRNRPLLNKVNGDYDELWKLLTSEQYKKHLIVVLNANDLRDSYINISKSLSWEKTALDFMWNIQHNTKDLMKALKQCQNLIVRFGLEGVVHYSSNNGSHEAMLYYNPSMLEDGNKEKIPGHMQGMTTAFVAGLTKKIIHSKNKNEPLSTGITEGIKYGMECSYRLYQYGYGKVEQVDGKSKVEPKYQLEKIFSHLETNAYNIRSSNISQRTDFSGQWTIMDENLQQEEEFIEACCDYVINGKSEKFDIIPFARYGKLQTYDRLEIESFQGIKNLIKEYINIKNPKIPLSIAVFGQPGSGKSFSIKQLTNSIQAGKEESINIEPIVFNISQFDSTTDLITAFHKIRDYVLEGITPIAFFDEFDTSLNGQDLGWLKYFLAPMQDGKFMDNSTLHPIGKSIFVFGGGIYHTFEEFNQVKNDKVKKTDFESRLRGYVNILGPNKLNDEDTTDKSYMIRRALLIRSLLKENAGNIFYSDDIVRIDRDLVKAMLLIKKYKHGSRSLEAILHMSMLSERKWLGSAALPPKEQLDLHVDGKEFKKLIMQFKTPV